jgi:aspartate racemase
MQKPTIGIIGGSGPLATLDIEQKILTFTQKLINPLTDQDYFNIVVLNYPGTYDRNDSVFLGQSDPLIQYNKYIKTISALGVDLIMLACNTAHMYLPILKTKTNTPIISIIEKTVDYIQGAFPKCRRVGIISTKATLEKKLYHNFLSRCGIEVISPNATTQNDVMTAIYLIKAGIDLTKEEQYLKNKIFTLNVDEKQAEILKNHPYKSILLQQELPNPKLIIQEAIKELKNKACQHIILGCTELPLVLPYLKHDPDMHLIDPNAIISQEIVKTLQNLEYQNFSNLKVINNTKGYI